MSATASADPMDEATVAKVDAALHSGKLTSRRLVEHYLARIAAVDRAGPKINSVIELNPDALAIADAMDRELKAGKARGPLHGVPVLIKDNIDTADRMHTTAGSLALADSIAPRDSTVAERLRAAGAVILGKTNLSEWANFRSSRSTSGWSGIGGLTRNPYVLDRNTSGSSSGSGAAMAADLAVVSIGTETDGSIVAPASANGVVGIKPTLGLVSRAGVIPIAHSQDTPGPITRTVADAAALLTVLAGSDPRDPATKDADAHRADYTKALTVGALKGVRIGVVRGLAKFNPAVDPVFEAALARMKAAGATIVDPVELPHAHELGEDELLVLEYEMKADLNAYLAGTSPAVKTRTLAEVIAFNLAHADREMSWFCQEHLLAAQARGGLDSEAYTEARDRIKRLAGPEGIDVALAKDHLDVLIAPTSDPVWATDLVNGDHPSAETSSPAAVAGYPAITVPMGFVHELPIGLMFFGAAWSEARLIGYAYAFEQATQARRPPRFLPTIKPD